MNDETNNINFYEIIPIDKTKAKKRNGTDFRSKHLVSDLTL